MRSKKFHQCKNVEKLFHSGIVRSKNSLRPICDKTLSSIRSGWKTCTHPGCDAPKPHDLFYKVKESLDGRSSTCRSCYSSIRSQNKLKKELKTIKTNSILGCNGCSLLFKAYPSHGRLCKRCRNEL